MFPCAPDRGSQFHSTVPISLFWVVQHSTAQYSTALYPAISRVVNLRPAISRAVERPSELAGTVMSSAGEASWEFLGPIELSWEMVERHQYPVGGVTVSHKQAHKWLKELRSSGEQIVDLTNAGSMDWRSYLASRHDAREVIGSGVARFEYRVIDRVTDSNRGSREDFVVWCRDGSAWRLHPSCSKLASTQRYEAIPVRGRPEDWINAAEARALRQAHGGRQRDDGAFHTISQADTISRAQALEFVRKLFADSPPALPFYVHDLSGHPTFAWHLWAHGVEALADLRIARLGCGIHNGTVYFHGEDISQGSSRTFKVFLGKRKQVFRMDDCAAERPWHYDDVQEKGEEAAAAGAEDGWSAEWRSRESSAECRSRQSSHKDDAEEKGAEAAAAGAQGGWSDERWAGQRWRA